MVPDDDEARWLIEEEPQASVTPLRSVPGPTSHGVGAGAGEATTDTVSVPDDVAEVIGLVDSSSPASVPDRGATEPEPGDEPSAKPASRRKRATVPSWDEILFGSKKPD